MVEELGELFAEERRDDGWGRLVATQTMGIGGADDGGLEKTVVTPDGHERLDDEGDETQILLWGLARGVEEGRLPFCHLGCQTPVVVLT